TGAGTRSMMGDKVVIGAKGSTIETGMHVPLIASWPKNIASGKVTSDLVDSTDFLPTICAAAGVNIPSDLKIDGKSFLPQLKGEPGTSRQWVYSWYSPHGEPLREFAFNQKYKLYRSGEFYDLIADPLEQQQPLKTSGLTGEAATAAKQFQTALDEYNDARPSSLPQPGRTEPKGKKAKNKAK
ncbi:MAG TPA: sulfatase/phosphatase domain-containing protein, partial [Pirellulaceae bacterium]|nr:sulfatase/phosphatase domain-containing protein [Pirellulaceae bacterium]